MANTHSTDRTQQSRSSAPGSAVAQRQVAKVVLPLVHCTIEVPRELIPYYAGLGAMAALELVEWPVALLIAAGHTLAARSRHQALREMGEGMESGG